MPSNANKKKYKKKARSCPLCKPHKMHWADNRTLQEKRSDITKSEQ